MNDPYDTSRNGATGMRGASTIQPAPHGAAAMISMTSLPVKLGETASLAVVIPAHNEALLLPRCLDSIGAAIRHPSLAGVHVDVIVVLDSCTDDSESIVAAYDCRVLRSAHRNVGLARAMGAAYAMGLGAQWLSFTDADSAVPVEWLASHRRWHHAGTDVVCGTITVDDWSQRSAACMVRHEAGYQRIDGHRHVHGANLGLSTAAYLAAGGFAPLRSSEDVALLAALEAMGAVIARPGSPSVITSGRDEARAPDGFAAFLTAIEHTSGVPG
ncbi:glycosyltransferase family 2 protein [Robbsia sp. KACC 23696]|uniref:glycosyltransferase n=1 Tax=Robbsia sp. KACC 23696 TaxID=3149231 RepID=UPI00325B11D7